MPAKVIAPTVPDGRASWMAALVMLVPLAAEPALADATLRLDLDAATDVALEENFGIRRARNDLARSQSSLIASDNEFDFQLATSFLHAQDLDPDPRFQHP